MFRRKWLYPHESLISILWKFEKANALSGAVVARLMGPDVDPYEGVAPRRGIVDVDRFRENLGLPGKVLHSALIEGTERQRYSDAFRFCRHCLTLGYHSVVHQLESLSQCPAHHGILESRCRRCGHETPHRISVRLLEARYRCANCLAPYARYGWTPYNAQPMKPEHRKAFTRRYLERCRG